MSHSGCVSQQGNLSTPISFFPWQSGLPFSRYNLTVKMQGQRSRSKVPPASSWLISSVFHTRASYRLPSPSFHDNRASHSRDTIWPWRFKVKGQGQMYPGQCSIQLTYFLSVSHEGILSTPVSFVPWQLGLPFPRYILTLKIQGKK